MRRDTDGDSDFNSLLAGSTDSASIESYYDNWAKTYDATLNDWDYHAPADAAATLWSHLKTGDNVLDVGCGTGMFAEAMSQRLKCRIAGIDISAASLEIAGEKGLYERLQRCDLQSTPLPLGDNEFDAAACVGVLTYIENATDLLRDLCRIVRPGGYIVLTQRDDRWVEKDFDTLLASFQARQLWSLPTISEAMPYLPKNEDFGDSVKVIQVLCQVLRCDRPSAFGGI